MTWWPFKRKKKVGGNPTLSANDPFRVFVRQFSQNLSMSDAHVEALYVPLFNRLLSQLKQAGCSHYIPVFYDNMIKLMCDRSGRTLPENIKPEQVLLYKEITSYVLALAVMSKLLAYVNVRHSLEAEDNGKQVFYPPFMNHIKHGRVKAIGVTQASHGVVGSRSETAMVQWMCYDLLLRSGNGMNWFATYPDMFAVLLRLNEGRENSQLGDLCDNYFGKILAGIGSREEVTPSSVRIANVSEAMAPSSTKETAPSQGESLPAMSQSEALDNLTALLADNASPVNSHAAKGAGTNEGSTSQEGGYNSSEHSDASTLTVPMNEEEVSNSPLSALVDSLVRKEEVKPGAGCTPTSEDVSEGRANTPPKPTTDEELRVYLDKLAEEFSREVVLLAAETGEVLVAVPQRVHRLVFRKMYKKLPTPARKESESALSLRIKQDALAQNDQHGMTYLTKNTEKWLVIPLDIVDKNPLERLDVVTSAKTFGFDGDHFEK